MKKMQIFEPAMCCSTGLCGVGVDTELLRISTALDALKKKDIIVERFNLSNAPQAFISNAVVNDLINKKGVDELPATVVDGAIVLTGRYPTNAEIAGYLDVPSSYLGDKAEEETATAENEDSGGCCSGGCC